VSIVVAPLTPTELTIGESPGHWYDLKLLEQLPSKAPIDLLVVDGPPAYRRGLIHARYPAVPYFCSRLADDYAVSLDDIHRRGEQRVIAHWERELDIQFERRFTRGRIAIGRSRGTYRL